MIKYGIIKNMKLYRLLGIEKNDLISVTGGGGKTTLIFMLCGELEKAGTETIITSTTRMYYPAGFPGEVLISEDRREAVRLAADRRGARFYAARRYPQGKAGGAECSVLDEMHRAGAGAVILNEADGAAGRPYKFYRNGEPVIPETTTKIIHVIGSETFGSAMSGEMFHRCPAEYDGRIFDAGMLRNFMEYYLTEKLAGCGAEKILLINKADSGREEKAELMKSAVSDMFDKCITASLKEERWYI